MYIVYCHFWGGPQQLDMLKNYERQEDRKEKGWNADATFLKKRHGIETLVFFFFENDPAKWW